MSEISKVSTLNKSFNFCYSIGNLTLLIESLGLFLNTFSSFSLKDPSYECLLETVKLYCDVSFYTFFLLQNYDLYLVNKLAF